MGSNSQDKSEVLQGTHDLQKSAQMGLISVAVCAWGRKLR